MGLRIVTKHKRGTRRTPASESTDYIFEFSDAEEDDETSREYESDRSEAEIATRIAFMTRARSTILALPIEILYEIYAFTTPRDLLNLCRTCKHFRATLLTRKASFTWTEVLAATGANLPTCPMDISLPAWVALFFGPPVCNICGGRSTRFVPWVFLRRFCNRCMEHQFCAHPDVPRVFPKLDADILKYVVPCRMNGVDFYLKSDIETVAHKILQFQQDTDDWGPGSALQDTDDWGLGAALQACFSRLQMCLEERFFRMEKVLDRMLLKNIGPECERRALSLKHERQEAARLSKKRKSNCPGRMRPSQPRKKRR